MQLDYYLQKLLMKKLSLIPNKTTIAAMQEAEAGNLDSFDSVEELLDVLNAKD